MIQSMTTPANTFKVSPPANLTDEMVRIGFEKVVVYLEFVYVCVSLGGTSSLADPVTDMENRRLRSGDGASHIQKHFQPVVSFR